MDRDDRLNAFALAVQQHLETRGSKTEVARTMGVPLSTLSGWINGTRGIGVQEAIDLESAIGVDPGALTIHLGFLPPHAREVTIASTEEAVIADSRLAGDQKRLVLDLVRQMVRSNE